MLILIAAVAAAAQTAPTFRAVDPAASQAAAALVQQLDLKGQIARQMQQTVALMRQGIALRSMLAQQPGFVQAYRANQAKFDTTLKQAGGIQADIAQKVINENSSAVVNAAVQAYARNFTAAELNGLVAFYRSPLGKAVNAKQPQVAAEIGQATNRLIGAKIDAAMQANAARITAALQPLNTAPQPAKK